MAQYRPVNHIIGSVSGIWICLLLANKGFVISKDDSWLLLLFVPALYVLGMISDYLGYLVLHKWKNKIERSMLSNIFEPGDFSTGRLHAYLVVYCPELAKELTIRSSRDRISRGLLINIPLVGISMLYFLVNNYSGVDIGSTVLCITSITTGLFIFTLFMWARFQRYSIKYEIHSRKVLEGVLRKNGVVFTDVSKDIEEEKSK